MTRVVPTENVATQRVVPPPAGQTSYTLVNDTDLVLTDASGVIASWSIVDGVLEVVTNAVAGIAYLLRPIPAFNPLAMHVVNVRAQRRIQATARVNLAWGVGGDPATTPSEINAAGIALEPFVSFDRPITWVNSAAGFGDTSIESDYCKGVVLNGAPGGNTATTQAVAGAGAVDDDLVSGTANHKVSSTLVYALQVEGFVIQNTAATAQTTSAEFATSTVQQDYTTPGNTSATPTPLAKLNPIGPLTLSAGWTLSDPSGIIATAPVSDGSTVTVGFNAIAGVAYLTRPLTSPDIDAVLTVTSMQRVNLPVTMTGSLGYGTGSVDGLLHNASGMQSNPTGVVTRVWRNDSVTGNGAGFNHFGIIGSSWMPASDPTSDGVAKWTGQNTAVRRSGASGNLSRANGPQVIELGSRYEVIRIENVDGLAAETLSWTFLSGIANFAYLPVVT